MNKGFDWDGFKRGDFVVYCRNRYTMPVEGFMNKLERKSLTIILKCLKMSI